MLSMDTLAYLVVGPIVVEPTVEVEVQSASPLRFGDHGMGFGVSDPLLYKTRLEVMSCLAIISVCNKDQSYPARSSFSSGSVRDTTIGKTLNQ